MKRRLITEATTAAVGEATERGTVPITIATPGWGSSGFYSQKVMENAVENKVFGKGLHLYMDHPGEAERFDRPERSVRDLVGTLTDDATWQDGTGIVAEAKIFGPYRDLFRDEDFVEAIGVSLRASADTTVGEAEGRKGTIITELIEAASVDFVTRAGRGGRVMAALESARAQASEATTDDIRDRLERALRDDYPPDADGYHSAWVVDFDPDASTFYFRNSHGLFAQGYTLTADGVDLGEGLMEVRQVATYVPVNTTTDASEASHQPPVAPAGSTPTHESPKEDTMPQIEESRLAQLEADAGRVHEADQARDQATARAEEAERTARTATNRAAAIEMIAESGHAFTALEKRGLLADLPVTDSGDIDTDAFTTALAEAAAESAANAGAGAVTGFGTTHTTDGEVTEADVDQAVARAFGRKPATEEA